jgi:hypothetical protein
MDISDKTVNAEKTERKSPVNLNVPKIVAQLQKTATKDLKKQYAEIFGCQSNSGNRVWLIKRIAWGIQAQQEGDISQRARQRALTLARNSDLRTTMPKLSESVTPELKSKANAYNVDCRLPMPGAVLRRKYKGQAIEVTVLTDGFLYQGAKYRSLSATAKAISGSHCNGYLFFGLTKGK